MFLSMWPVLIYIFNEIVVALKSSNQQRELLQPEEVFHLLSWEQFQSTVFYVLQWEKLQAASGSKKRKTMVKLGKKKNGRIGKSETLFVLSFKCDGHVGQEQDEKLLHCNG